MLKESLLRLAYSNKVKLVDLTTPWRYNHNVTGFESTLPNGHMSENSEN
jgi:hypothetical protein